MKDYYYILGIDDKCTLNDVKVAYRKLSKKFHPDLNPNDKYFEDRFKDIQEAFDTLRDPLKRVKYDAKLKRLTPEPPDAEHLKRQYEWEHAKEFKRKEEELKRKAAASVKSKTRALDIGFTIVLIFITCLFADYVYKAMHTPVKAAAAKMPVAALVVFRNETTGRKKKHNRARLTKPDSSKVSDESVVVDPAQSAQAQTVAINRLPVQTLASVPEKQVLAPTVNKTESEKDYLYATSVRSNLTGVINMRKLDKFSSEVIDEIPNNSKVYVLDKGDVYYKIAFNNDIGYVPKWALQNK